MAARLLLEVKPPSKLTHELLSRRHGFITKHPALRLFDNAFGQMGIMTELGRELISREQAHATE